MLWDGVTFFGFDKNKLDRIRGIKTSFFDVFRDFQWVVITFMTFTLVSFVLVSEAHKLGEVKQ